MQGMKMIGLAAMLAALQAAPALAEGDAERGKSLFGRCSACHAVTPQNKVGPHLAGIMGRAAGTVAGARYSKAMAVSGLTWTPETLESFLAAPTKMLPGTTMPLGVPNAKDRADLIAYLASLTAP